jgi:hypothetical protein
MLVRNINDMIFKKVEKASKSRIFLLKAEEVATLHMTRNLVKNQLSWTCRSYDLYIKLKVAVKTNDSFMKY